MRKKYPIEYAAERFFKACTEGIIKVTQEFVLWEKQLRERITCRTKNKWGIWDKFLAIILIVALTAIFVFGGR